MNRRSGGKPADSQAVEDSTTFDTGVHWAMAALLLGGAAVAAWFFRPYTLDFKSPNFNPFIFVSLALAAFGLKSLYSAVRGTMLRARFGSSTLDVEGGEATLGGTLKGVIRASTKLAPRGDYTLKLSCIEQITTYDSIDTTKQRQTDHVRWETSKRVPPASVDARAGIPFEFKIPEGCLASGDDRAKGAVRWVLEAHAPMEGLDYSASFGVIVRKPR